jgi:hypothetical protein
MFEAFFLKLAANAVSSKIGPLLKRVPWQVWAAIVAILLIAGGVWFHQRAVKQLQESSYAAGAADGSAREKKTFAASLAKARADATTWRVKYEDKAAALTKEIGERNALEARNIAARADALRLRGPGQAAACSGSGTGSGPAAGAGGREPASGPGNAALAGMPEDEPMAIVPWGDLVGFGEGHDLDRSEVLTWRAWYARNAELLREARTSLPNIPNP